MEIKGLGNSLPYNQGVKKKSESEPSPESKDKIEISSKARQMAETEKTPEKLEEIRNKIQQKFYESDEVLSKVADSILKDLNK